MKRPILGAMLGALLLLGACTSPENEGRTPLPSSRSEPALYEDGIGPSDDQEELDEEGDESAP